MIHELIHASLFDKCLSHGTQFMNEVDRTHKIAKDLEWKYTIVQLYGPSAQYLPHDSHLSWLEIGLNLQNRVFNPMVYIPLSWLIRLDNIIYGLMWADPECHETILDDYYRVGLEF